MGRRFAGALLVASGLTITFLSVFAAALAFFLAAIPAALGVVQLWAGIRIAIGGARPSGLAYLSVALSSVLGALLLQSDGSAGWAIVAGAFLIAANVMATWLLMRRWQAPTDP